MEKGFVSVDFRSLFTNLSSRDSAHRHGASERLVTLPPERQAPGGLSRHPHTPQQHRSRSPRGRHCSRSPRAASSSLAAGILFLFT